MNNVKKYIPCWFLFTDCYYYYQLSLKYLIQRWGQKFVLQIVFWWNVSWSSYQTPHASDKYLLVESKTVGKPSFDQVSLCRKVGEPLNQACSCLRASPRRETFFYYRLIFLQPTFNVEQSSQLTTTLLVTFLFTGN